MHHINYLELLAVFLGLPAFYQTHHDIHVRLMIDNSTAVAVINHMGTSHSTVLNALCKQIWEWCVLRNIWISAAHIPGKANTEADLESRENRTETEWMLNKDLLAEALVPLISDQTLICLPLGLTSSLTAMSLIDQTQGQQQ